jgi:hypothetical protein
LRLDFRRSIACSTQGNFFGAAGWHLRQPKPDGWVIATEALREAATAYGTTVIGSQHSLED